jgi:hypothetical protein
MCETGSTSFLKHASRPHLNYLSRIKAGHSGMVMITENQAFPHIDGQSKDNTLA